LRGVYSAVIKSAKVAKSHAVNGEKTVTKKDYVAIAKVINGVVYVPSDEINGSAEDVRIGVRWAQKHIAEGLAEVFANANPEFKRDRFLTECGATV